MYTLKESQNFFMQYLPLDTLCLFSMLLSDHVVNIKKPDRICSHTFFVTEFSELSLHPSVFFYLTFKIK